MTRRTRFEKKSPEPITQTAAELEESKQAV
jgi:hypothetical protein